MYLGCGVGSCIGFIIVAVRVQTWKFVRAAIISVVACAVGFASNAIWPPVEDVNQNTGSRSSTDLDATSTSTWIIMVIWIGLIVYGHVLNRDYEEFLHAEDDENYLRWQSTKAQAQAFYAPPTGVGASAPPYVAPPAPSSSAPSAPPVDHLRFQADEYLATQTPGNAPGMAPPNTPAV